MRMSLVFIATCAVLVGCSTAPPKPDLAFEEQAIREMDTRWQQAVHARDARAQAAIYPSDGVAYRAGETPLIGPASILTWEAKSASENPKADSSWTTDQIRVAAAGDVAVQTGEAHITGMGRNGEDRTVRRERLVTVWKKVDGEWKVAHDISSSLP
jgi:uncharacterized protein (TIGR02246 family)